MIKYFHELTEEEFAKLVEQHMTWGECAKLYPQPSWCEYPNAVEGEMGCWSLMLHKIHNFKDCNGCALQKPNTRLQRTLRWLRQEVRPAINRFVWFKLGLLPRSRR